MHECVAIIFLIPFCSRYAYKFADALNINRRESDPAISLKAYIAIARPDHWTKNVFVLPGALIPAVFLQIPFSDFALRLMIGLVSVCLVASANYVLNEWLDAIFDRHHPKKKNRPSVSGDLRRRIVYSEYGLLAVAGLGIAALVSREFFFTAFILLVMGVVYNVKPFRTKDRVYLDVLTESFNNPLRLALGWFCVTNTPLPTSSLVMGYWMGGAFLMGIKRFAEYRLIDDPAVAGDYRKSFRGYTEEKLLISSFFYAMFCSTLMGVFLVKYRIELLLFLPFLAALFAWYFHLAYLPDSPVQYPEKLHRQTGFMIYCSAVGLVFVLLLLVDVPPLRWFLNGVFIVEQGP